MNVDRIGNAAGSGDEAKGDGFRLGPHIAAGVAFAFVLVGGVGGWAALASLEGAIIAQGAVKVRENLKEVQHRDGGIVSAIAVRQGDTVREGDVLIRLDDVQTRAELSIVRSQLAENLGRQARLIAERDVLDRIAFPGTVTALSPDSPTIMLGEHRLFEGNRTARESQKEQLTLGIEQTGAEIRGLEARRNAKNEEIAVVGAERTKLDDLFARGHIPNTRVHGVKIDAIRLQGEWGEIEASIARAKVRIGEMRLQIIAIDQNARNEAQRELRAVEAKISELQDRRLAIEDRLARSEIRAPISGTVNEVAVHTIGGVITPAAKIATIVPEGADLRVEIKLAPVDIDQVRHGQSARLRFTSFHRNTTPELQGTVVHLASAATRDPATGATHYLGEVQFSDTVSKLGNRQILPGMPVEVFVSTEERTALSYLVKPFMDQFQRIFREE